MADETTPASGNATSICPWCSASYSGAPERCPSCGATLGGDAGSDQSLPGLTAIDAAAIVRSKEPVKRQRSRLLSWISGDYADEPTSSADAGALAPPDADVRREILRLELEAEVANLQAEADALRAQATVEGRLPEATPEDAAAAAAVVAQIDEVSAGLEDVDQALETDALLGPPDADADVQPDAAVVAADAGGETAAVEQPPA